MRIKYIVISQMWTPFGATGEYKRMCGRVRRISLPKQYQYAKEYFDIVKSEIGIKEV